MSEKSKHKRLTEVFNSSRRIPFTDEDRFVFFSDVHRGNNSWADEFARNQIIYSYALQHYYDSGYTYVEVGDGDELWKFKDIRTIRIAHEHIYKLLQKFHRKDRFYYIFGNHDMDYRNPVVVDARLNHHFGWVEKDTDEILFDDFCVYEGLVFQHQESGTDLFVVHGHQGELFNDRLHWLSKFLLRGLWGPLQLMGMQNPFSVSQNAYQRKEVELQLSSWVGKVQQPIICGHTHKERFPQINENAYFNIGSCIHPRWISCIEVKKGRISLVRWRIKPRKKGSLFVKRDILAGPAKLTDFENGQRGKNLPEIPVEMALAEVAK